MSTDQRNEEFIEPSPDEIVAFTKEHVKGMEGSDEDEWWNVAGMLHVLIQTVGRKTGNVHKVALPYWEDKDGSRVVVASFAGAEKNPSWFVNLADKKANPTVLVRVQGGTYWSEAEVLDGDDYAATWAALIEDRAYYANYQTRCERRIPLVRLPETNRVATRG
ncbi:nitroreductase/quinone reductase family protein [Yinghuangia seranimata]|uniref:nitroreductase/quinone reductase family protein n=1 Tax=Yinghuangia seranimata TaxID=408067 RepID=UPI00248AF546|nr:nitroreductase/quinone reductase family protein [Yinghuangia seranimata]MDI2125293.1 nitroreductase/quinone reductase family protein [Yinghuangia seranimata]